MKRILGIALLCGSLWQCQSKHGAKPSDPVHSQKGKGTETEIVAPLTPAEAAEQAAQASADFIANNCGTDTNTPGPCAAAEATQALANTPTDGGSNALVDAYTQLQTDPDVQTAVQDAGTNAAIDQAVASAEAGDTSTPAPGNSMAKNGVMFTGVGLLSLGFIAFAGGYGVQTAIEKGYMVNQGNDRAISPQKAKANRAEALKDWGSWAKQRGQLAVEFFTSLPSYFTRQNLVQMKEAIKALPGSVADGLMHALSEAKNLNSSQRQGVWGRLKGIIEGIRNLTPAQIQQVGSFLVGDGARYWPEMESFSLLYNTQMADIEKFVIEAPDMNEAWEKLKLHKSADSAAFRQMYQMDEYDHIVFDKEGKPKMTPEYERVFENDAHKLVEKYQQLNMRQKALISELSELKVVKTGNAALKNIKGHMQSVKYVAQGRSSLYGKAQASKVAGIGAMIVGGVFAAAGGSMNLADGTDSNPASDYLTTMGNLYNGLVAQPQ